VILMDKSFLRLQSRRVCEQLMNYVMVELNEKDLGRSAIVFSPHPDDETLGCGGTIIKKIRAGAEVKIVFMTDGQKSHQHLISESKLKSMRTNEALAASKKLGVEEAAVFLGFEDGELSKNQNSAIKKVLKILLSQQLHEIFIPYYKEPLLWSADHLAANRIVLAALQAYGKKVVIYEYPIWYWYHWPWISMPIGNLGRLLVFLKDSLVSPLSLLRDFRCSIFVGDVLELKRDALDQYASQMKRIIPDPRWLTLSDISNGEFLECFFQDHEVFRRYVFPTRN
jgi:LmbE family N-acetylglucosaminyl deacetylase